MLRSTVFELHSRSVEKHEEHMHNLIKKKKIIGTETGFININITKKGNSKKQKSWASNTLYFYQIQNIIKSLLCFPHKCQCQRSLYSYIIQPYISM